MENKIKENNNSFEQTKELLKLKRDLLDLEYKHKVELETIKMRGLEYIRETERLKHNWILEQGRIKSAEIRRTQERKAWIESNNPGSINKKF